MSSWIGRVLVVAASLGLGISGASGWAVGPGGGPSLGFGSPTPGLADQLREILLDQINRDRQAVAASSVEFSRPLSDAADRHCREMLANGFTNHWNLSGESPYLRYSRAGIPHFTSENISSIRATPFDSSPAGLEAALLERHRSLVDEKPPFDWHRRSILDPRQTHVGIGIAFGEEGLVLIEVFAKAYAEVDPLPDIATAGERVVQRGKVLDPRYSVDFVVVHWEPLPQPRTVRELREAAGSYSLPERERALWPRLPQTQLLDGRVVYPRYADGSSGDVVVSADGRFRVPIPWFAGEPGIYTVVTWICPAGESGLGRGFPVTSHSIRVE